MNHVPQHFGLTQVRDRSPRGFRALRLCLLVLSIFVGALGAQDTHQAVALPRVRLGWLPLFYGLPHFVADRQDLYRKHGIQVESLKFATSNDLADALAAGRIDVAVPTALSVLFALEARAPGTFRLFVVYATRADSPTDYLLVRKDSEIHSLADLKGKRLGTFPGSTMRLYARLALKPDLDLPADAQVIDLRSDMQLPALLSGQVDALLTYDADAVVALRSSQVRVLLAGVKGRIMDPFPSGGYAFSSEFWDKDRKTATAVIAAIRDAVNLIQSDPVPARKSAIHFLPALPLDVVDTMSTPDYWVVPDVALPTVTKYMEILNDAGELSKKIDVSKLFAQ